MNFTVIKKAILEILIEKSGGCYQVIDHQKQRAAADQATGNNRQVQVFYSDGTFPPDKGGRAGGIMHHANYRIQLTVAGPSKVDLDTLNDPNMPAFEKAEVLAAAQSAGLVADESMDELITLVYQALMDAKERDLRQTTPIIGYTWIDQVQKDQPDTSGGEFVVLTANMFFEVRMSEAITGVDTPTTGNLFDVTVDIKDDDIEKTGVTAND